VYEARKSVLRPSLCADGAAQYAGEEAQVRVAQPRPWAAPAFVVLRFQRTHYLPLFRHGSSQVLPLRGVVFLPLFGQSLCRRRLSDTKAFCHHSATVATRSVR